MSTRNETLAELSSVASEVLGKLAILDNIPYIGTVALQAADILHDDRPQVTIQIRSKDAARWAELFDTNVVISESTNRFSVEITSAQYDHVVHLWTYMDLSDVVSLYRKAGLDFETKRHELTAKQLRNLAAPKPRVSQEILDELAAPAPLRDDPCPYTHAHTRHFCGRPTCRES